ncbi:hypothetical protein [Streptomyces sp. NPDC059071]|uniref:hypothetical protein n=1 Tax=unclassified Streptomyces TaxID=2593676 RepID=UPI00365892D6
MAKDEGRRTPQEFRELLKGGYDYPAEVDAERGRRRRRARRAYRRSERQRTTAWIEQERRREPISARAALLVVAVLLGVGALARFGPDSVTGRDHGADKVAPAPSASTTGADDKPSATASAPSPSPSAPVDLSDPNLVAEQFTRHYLTRNPPVDQDHTAAVRRAAPWATEALVENLAGNDDPAFGRLVSRGGVATVDTVTVGPASDKLPPDTPLRVWRIVTAKVDVVGYTTYTETTTLQIELTNTGAGWRVARILGV